jgi:phage terminase large subunit-like protein
VRSEKYPWTNKGNKYAREVVSGKILACKWVKLACQRHLDELARQKDADYPYRFDKAKAEKFFRFAANFPHVEGEWAKRKELIVLQPWDCFIYANIFGWVRKADGLRRFREAYVEVSRKNAKSTKAAIVGHYMLVADGEIGAEIYSGATTEKQAWEVFGPAREMAKKAHGFKEHYGVQVNAKTLTVLDTNSKFEPLIGDPGDGANPSCAIIDEYHEHKSPALYNTMTTGMGSRSQPLTFIVTTAGTDLSGPCYDKRNQVCKVLEGSIDNDEIFGIIFTIDEGDEWTDFKCWPKANPNLNVSVKEDYLKKQLRDAIQRSSQQNAIKTKHLNVWCNASVAWMNMVNWQKSTDRTLELSDFYGQRCRLAVDLASKIDLAAMIQLFRKAEDYYCFAKFYLPESALEGADKTHYQGWYNDGWITTTPGNIIDFAYIEEDMKEIRGNFEVVEVAYDPFQATQFSTRMMAEGFPMVEYGATVKNFSEPMKELEATVMDGRFHHDGNPVLEWNISNIVAFLDRKDNIFPRKERPENKIDGGVALIMAMARAMIDESFESIYETAGF